MPVASGHPDLLIGLESPDDAAVYRLDGDRALIASVDFFTPLVDGPEDFGAIAAANALSDLYAMGASPLLALNILAVPAGKLPDEVVAGILRGAASVCEEAGIPIAGGHSIDDDEPKFGLVVIGLGSESSLYRKGGARVDDVLVLGKAIGTGVVTTGIKRDAASPEAMEAAIASMRSLNRRAAEALAEFDVHAVTDVTGFGLLGHLLEMCRASDVAVTVSANAPIVLPQVFSLIESGCIPGGTERNRWAVEPEVEWADGIPESLRVLLCDAQTSGGLLVALPADQGRKLVGKLGAEGYAAATVGRVVARWRPGDARPRIQVTE